MFKTGIYEIQQIDTGVKQTNLFGATKRISITLYDQIINRPNADQLAERILLMFTDERGAYKRTYANRFEEFDNQVIAILKENIAGDTQLSMHDVAVSNGCTAVDFFRILSQTYPQIIYHASDYSPKVYVIEKGNTKLTLSHNHNLIEIVWPPFVFNSVLPDRYWYEPINRVIQLFVEKFVAKPILQEYKAGKLGAKEIFLYAPEALVLAKRDIRFQLSAHDLLQPLATHTNVIRAMNILNPGYFSKSEFKQVIKNLYNGLQEQGLLIVGSNQDSGSTVNGGIYQKTASGFRKIWNSGSGPQIEDLILE